MSTTPAINPYQRFSVIAGVVVTGDKFIAGDNDTGEQGVWSVYGSVFSWLLAAGDIAVLV
jgi:hypothetical protein